MNKSHFIITILFISCLSTKDLATDDYLFSIGFTGDDLEKKTIELYVDNTLIFEKILLKKRDNILNLYDDVVVYKKGVFELQGIGNGFVKRKKKFFIKNLNKITVSFVINCEKSKFTINVEDGKYYHLRFDKSEIELFEFRHGRRPVYRKIAPRFE